MNTIIDSEVDETSVVTDCVLIRSKIVGSNIKNCTVIDSVIRDSNANDSYFKKSDVSRCGIIEFVYCNNGILIEALDIVRCHIDGDKDDRVVISSGGRPVVLTRCWFTKNTKVSGGDAWNSYFGKNSVVDNCDILNSEFENITVSRRIIENNVVGDYELPISKGLVVIEIDDEEI